MREATELNRVTPSLLNTPPFYVVALIPPLWWAVVLYDPLKVIWAAYNPPATTLALRDAGIVWVAFWKCDFGVEHHSASNRFDFAIAITLSAYSGSVA